MTPDALSVRPTSNVHAAVMLLREHDRLVLPVVEDGSVVGVIDAATLFLYQPDIVVGDVMSPPASVDANASLSAAATAMREHCLAEIPVVGDALLGVLKGTDLLSAWAMPVDPLTGLPWQDSFRLRSTMRLSSGEELTLLFFDMDDLGALNKRLGHVVGDNALKAVADAIRNAVETSFDEACRFGGDEFVVATTRPRDEAIRWAESVRSTVLSSQVEGLDAPLGVSVGAAGGLRRAERVDSYPPATLDDLINRASQASTKAKLDPGHLLSLDSDLRISPSPPSTARGPALTRPARVRIRGASTLVGASSARADVRLEHCGIIYSGSHEGAVSDGPSLAAAATAAALSQFLPASYAVYAAGVEEQAIMGEGRVMMAVVRLESPFGSQNLVGVADVASDPCRATVKAVLDALNRSIEAITQTPESPALA
jgi:diguanylate cyclase (GGDEF)-like protein